MNIAVTGATGRMGRAVLERAADRDDLTVSFAASRDPDIDRIAEIRLSPEKELESLLDRRRPNALIDFTVPDASVRYAQQCAQAAVPIVIGTTGFDAEQRETLATVAERVPVLTASNFAPGMVALQHAAETVAQLLDGYDIEVTETFHNRKSEAPGGTANAIVDRLEAVRGELTRVHGREGQTGRADDEIGIHSRRAGDVRGDHEVLFADNDETISLTHRTASRDVYAAGALDAAVWLAGQPPELYEFADALLDN
ncbi:MAG: 4-hydroxy-tetrahydrodipicolinate reductase [Halobacteriales archaeon]|nr:4-hydroxy-tetrahydrodipicolinate reductase [Halobacteriales archaeon]